MTEICYSIEREFMKKTFEAIDRHVDVETGYLPVRPALRGCSDQLVAETVDSDPTTADGYDRAVRAIDPDVLVLNHWFPLAEASFPEEYPVVHIRHGASLGRGEIEVTNKRVLDHVDLALAPGERWARQYDGAVDVRVVGVPEADVLVRTDPPQARRVLYAPTNHNYGGGSFCSTARHILDVFADTEYELFFRPHPMDRTEEPGKSLVTACRKRIADLPNVTFDDHPTPCASMLDADILVSDYSGIVTEWLHTDRPLVQLTDTAAADDVPLIGYATDRLDIETVDQLYRRGYPPNIEQRVETVREQLGIPMDGRAGERAATEVLTCTQ